MTTPKNRSSTEEQAPGTVADVDEDDGGTALWRAIVDALIAKGSTPAEAIVGANLILEARKRQRTGEPPPDGDDV